MKLSVQALETYKLFTDTNKNELYIMQQVFQCQRTMILQETWREGYILLFIEVTTCQALQQFKNVNSWELKLQTSTVEQLNKMDKRSKYYKAYVKRATVRLRKQVNFKRKVAAHRYRKDAKRTDYRKGRLDPTLPVNGILTNRTVHV
ncbi:hypothetical protein FSP39_015370 [Pinctada imbricata]|uniref:Uncharacterized protein n=1 Tax=Pinctada imbricata TaxID=66713 RepID=A0AA88XD72_PINIB|nr:hypothetical protein FSP39_015370 [Pinctada imbricata]